MAKYKYCAGILPYCYYNDCLYFLLGKSKRNNRLITFSGKNDELEDDPCETAAREGYEETLGCILDKNTILEKVKNCNKILISKTPRGMPCYTYVIEIPYRRHYSICFRKTREFLYSMGFSKMYHLQEMIDIKWICEYTMFTKLRKGWEKNGLLQSNDEWKKLLTLVRMQRSNGNWRNEEQSDTGENDDVNDIILSLDRINLLTDHVTQ
jgi:hypothetical protein